MIRSASLIFACIWLAPALAAIDAGCESRTSILYKEDSCPRVAQV